MRRGLLIGAGVFICIFSLAVLYYVQSIPDLGLRSAFGTEIKDTPVVVEGVGPREGDLILKVGDLDIKIWPDLLAAPFLLKNKIASLPERTSWHKKDGENVDW